MLDPFCPLPNIDFDTWAELASSDPEAFETQRKRFVEEFLNQIPEDRRERLRCLQWRIDRIREVSHTPMAACLKISRMMWDSVLGPNGLLETLQELSHGNGALLSLDREGRQADVLPFPARSEQIKAGY